MTIVILQVIISLLYAKSKRSSRLLGHLFSKSSLAAQNVKEMSYSLLKLLKGKSKYKKHYRNTTRNVEDYRNYKESY